MAQSYKIKSLRIDPIKFHSLYLVNKQSNPSNFGVCVGFMALPFRRVKVSLVE